MIDAGAEDIVENKDFVEIRSSVGNFQKVLEAIQSFEIEPEDSGLEWVAKEEISVDENVAGKVEALYEALDELDDVKSVYSNDS